MASTTQIPPSWNGQLGYTGLPTYSGIVFDEWLRDLQGPSGRRVIREMRDNHPIIGAVMHATEMMMRQAEWFIQDDPDAPEGDVRGEYVDSCLHDMSVTWLDRLSEILSFLEYGWSLHEQIFKVRNGVDSKYNDGRIGWADWPIRGQETLLRWEFDPAQNVVGMWQMGPPRYQLAYVPLEKALLFRTTVKRGNPEGRSVLRNAYTPWYFGKKIQIFEGIGVERDLAGIPYLRIPGEIMRGETPEAQKAFADYKALVEGVRTDENHGIILPSDYDPETKQPLYTFELLTSGGKKQFDTDAIIDRYDERIAMTVLADFILLGHQAVGSNALSQDKSGMFTDALNAWLSCIRDVINDFAIPRLLRLNGMSTDFPPRLEHGDIERVDLDGLGNYILRLAEAGVQLDTRFNSELTKALHQKAKLPDPPEEMPAELIASKYTTPEPVEGRRDGPASDGDASDDEPV